MLVVVGGHSRNIGKTSVVAGLIRKLRDRKWTAVKITQYGHGVCANEGKACDCAPTEPEHPFALPRRPTPRPPSAKNTSRAAPIPAASSPPAPNVPSGSALPPASSRAPP